MFNLYSLRRWPLLSCVLLLFLAACAASPLDAATGSSNSGTAPTITASTPGGGSPGSKSTLPPPSATVPMPAVQASCPANGTARAAVIEPLALGHHATLVYIVNEQSGNTPTFGTLKRYDTVTGKKVEIVKQAHTMVSEAEISADGQWVLFVSVVARQARLQLIRMDGQGLQTLYCVNAASNGADPTSALNHVQWSTDQKLIAFDSYSDAGGAVFILNAKMGTLQRDLYTPGSGAVYPVRTWLDHNQLYITNPTIDAPASSVFILNTLLGGNQTTSDLRQVLDEAASQFCWDFDSSFDGRQLFASQCQETPDPNGPGAGSLSGPSSIITGSATGGGALSTIFTNASLAIVSLRCVSANTLLLQTASTSTATANNGLWRVQTDGSGLKQLISFGGGVGASGMSGTLNRYGQYPWSNVSRDGRLYAFEEDSSTQNTTTLLFGSLNGGSPTTLASIGAGTVLSVAGWTTM